MKPALCLFALLLCPLAAQGIKPLTVEDIMKFRKIKEPVIEVHGTWIGYISEPDRGDSHAILRATSGSTTYEVPNGVKVVLARGGAWAAVEVGPDALFKESADKDALSAYRSGVCLVNLADGVQESWPETASFAFSEDGAWLAVLQHAPKEEGEDGKNKATKGDLTQGGKLLLRKLESGHLIEINDVTAFSFSGKGAFITYASGNLAGDNNGLYYRHLAGDHSAQIVLATGANATYPQIAWDSNDRYCAWLEGTRASAEEEADRREHQLKVWEAKSAQTRLASTLSADIHIPFFQELRWSKDSERLFFGTRVFPKAKEKKEDPASITAETLYDVERLRKLAGLDVWHGKDARIKPNERKAWSKRDEKRTYTAVWWPSSKKMVQLGSATLPHVFPGEQSDYLLAATDIPHQLSATWTGALADFYAVNLKTGDTSLIVSRLSFEIDPADQRGISLSPGSRYAAYYQNGKVFLHDIRRGKTRLLSENSGVPFANEDHDYPAPAPGYGFGGWVANDAAVLVYDKYDIWSFPTVSNKTASMLTNGDGRERSVQYRIAVLDKEKLSFAAAERVLLSAYFEKDKHHGFYRAEIGANYIDKRLEDNKSYTILAAAKEADVLIFTREDFREFPDIWGSDSGLNHPKRLSNENPQLGEFALGEPRLVEWSADGVPHQGVLYLPGNYREGMRYPVLVYFYRIFSNRMYKFNEMVLNHRPNFPFYTSNGYAVFLPDIHFQVGTPGFSATKSLVPGVQKIIDMGIADPDAIGLHGHSWSGYQTAFTITQTNIFKAAVAGAPVSNMTSAYSGIRLGSGLARQFQYEQGQSRIGKSMWERRDLYIENSPVFFADRIETPLLIEFGDIDEAVPWEQGIELYLAMRRLSKDVVFLQYHDEPHHLKKYPNKLDYTLKMKEFFDHHLKGDPAPAWMTQGVPYQGE